MKLPDKIKGNNKIRDLEICRLWIDEGITDEDIGVNFGITQRRVRQILENNKVLLVVDRALEKAKRIHLIRAAIKESEQSTKDRADLIEQLRKEIEGNGPLVDNSIHITQITNEEKVERSNRLKNIFSDSIG